MSELSVGQLKGLTVNNNTITVPSGHKLYAPGSVVQVVYKRTDARSVYTVPTSGDGVGFAELATVITPKFANSLLVMHITISGESHYNDVFTMLKNGSLITQSGYEGYNSSSGNNYWSGVAITPYDGGDIATTPWTCTFQYAIPAGSTSTATYTPAVRANDANTYFTLNRAYNNAGAGGNENGTSHVTIWEIAQ